MRYSYYSIVVTVVYQKLDVSAWFVFFKMPSRRSRREKNRAKKIAKLNDDCCVGESQDIEERDSFQEAHEKKKTCDKKRYKADHESKKDSMKAQYWLDPESKRESAKAQYWLDPESKKDSAKAQYCLDPESKKETAKAQYCRKRNIMR